MFGTNSSAFQARPALLGSPSSAGAGQGDVSDHFLDTALNHSGLSVCSTSSEFTAVCGLSFKLEVLRTIFGTRSELTAHAVRGSESASVPPRRSGFAVNPRRYRARCLWIILGGTQAAHARSYRTVQLQQHARTCCLWISIPGLGGTSTAHATVTCNNMQ